MRSKTLEGTNSRITEAEDRKNEVEDRMVEINETERKKEKGKEMRTTVGTSGAGKMGQPHLSPQEESSTCWFWLAPGSGHSSRLPSTQVGDLSMRTAGGESLPPRCCSAGDPWNRGATWWPRQGTSWGLGRDRPGWSQPGPQLWSALWLGRSDLMVSRFSTCGPQDWGSQAPENIWGTHSVLDSVALVQSGSVCWEWFIKAEAKKTGPQWVYTIGGDKINPEKRCPDVAVDRGWAGEGKPRPGALRGAVSPGAGLRGGGTGLMVSWGRGRWPTTPKEPTVVHASSLGWMVQLFQRFFLASYTVLGCLWRTL